MEMLLADIRHILGNKHRISSFDLVAGLSQLQGRPWAEYGRARRPISQNQLANALKPIGVGPNLVRIDGTPCGGYDGAWFDDAFARYLGGSSSRYGVTNPEGAGTSDLFQGVTAETDVTVLKCEKFSKHEDCNAVTDWERVEGEDHDDLPF